MNVKATFALAFAALVRNKARSLLTMLGIVIGVAAVIVTVAIGVGARTSVQQSINSLGSNLIVVQPGSVTQTGARTGFGGASSLTPADGLAIAQLPGVAAVSPSVTLRTQIVAGANNWQTTITGVAPTYTSIRSWPLANGRFFGENEVASAAKVAVLGQTVVGQLFPDGGSPVGQTVLIRGTPFTVVGTLSPLGQSGLGQDQDDIVLIPYTSAMERLTGLTTVNALMVSAAEAQEIDAVTQSVTTLLEQRHRIVPPQTDDFQVRNLQAIAQTASATGTVMELLLAGVAAVSLVVGGIGIMNIMLVSVTERTREIGLRMAVGARANTILRQFLAESIVLSTIGGLLGVIAGGLGTIALALLTQWPTSDSAAVGPRLGRVLGDGRHLLRLLSRTAGGGAQSDRGAAVRMTSRIAVIDDEPHIREVLSLALGHHGFAVRCAADGAAGLELVRDWSPDVIVLDVMLPKASGIELLPEIRRVTDAPIVMLSARGEVEDKVEGLAHGADDYISKPFEISELLAHIEAKLRRPHIEAPEVLQYEGLSVDLHEHVVERDGRGSISRRSSTTCS